MVEIERRLKGSCLCGGVRISVPDRFAYFGTCHCSQCRKFSGSAFSVFAGVPFAEFEIANGESQIGYFEKSETGTLAFCSQCGSSLFGIRSDIEMMHVRAGILDDVPSQKPNSHCFVGSKAPWHIITDEIRQYEELPQPRKRN
jgi:hypothetical protein